MTDSTQVDPILTLAEANLAPEQLILRALELKKIAWTGGGRNLSLHPNGLHADMAVWYTIVTSSHHVAHKAHALVGRPSATLRWKGQKYLFGSGKVFRFVSPTDHFDHCLEELDTNEHIHALAEWLVWLSEKDKQPATAG